MAIIHLIFESSSQPSVILPCADSRRSEVSSGGCGIAYAVSSAAFLASRDPTHHGTSIQSSVVERQIGHCHGV
jgi:hypothetical protein